MDPTTARETEATGTPAQSGDLPLPAAPRRMIRAFPWHVGAFLLGNLLLNGINALTGSPWWAFWPLLATALLLGVHYLCYKAATVDERWAQARTEELNLKSYDRSHIEGLKSRYGGDDMAGDRRG